MYLYVFTSYDRIVYVLVTVDAHLHTEYITYCQRQPSLAVIIPPSTSVLLLDAYGALLGNRGQILWKQSYKNTGRMMMRPSEEMGQGKDPNAKETWPISLQEIHVCFSSFLSKLQTETLKLPHVSVTEPKAVCSVGVRSLKDQWRWTFPLTITPKSSIKCLQPTGHSISTPAGSCTSSTLEKT